MADNYLENQYEQYQARKAAWEKAGKKQVSPSPKSNQEKKKEEEKKK